MTWLRGGREPTWREQKIRPRLCLGAGSLTSLEAAGKPEAFVGPPAKLEVAMLGRVQVNTISLPSSNRGRREGDSTVLAKFYK